MTSEEALEIVEQILPPGALTPVQTLVFQRSWAGEEYAAIARELGYDYGYIRETGAQLWRSLSLALQEPVKKKNFRSLLQQRFSTPAKLLRQSTLAAKSIEMAEIPEFPGGPLSVNSKFYIEHSTLEAKAFHELHKAGGLLHIKAPWKMGKSSFLLRMTGQALSLGYRVATLDFKQADLDVFSNISRLVQWFCTNISLQLGITPQLDQYLDEYAGSKVGCTLYLTQYLLKQFNTPLVLVLNDLDQVLDYPDLGCDFLRLLRSWYEGARQGESLQQLRMVLASSTDFCVPLRLQQSPFNDIGLPLELPELSVLQVQVLAQRYELNGLIPEALHQIMDWVGGHPYLIQQIFYHLWSGELSLDHILDHATTLSGVYGYHLQSCLALLQANPELAVTLLQIMNPSQTDRYPNLTVLAKLKSLGFIKQEDGQIKIKYKLYQHYFQSHLPLILRGTISQPHLKSG